MKALTTDSGTTVPPMCTEDDVRAEAARLHAGAARDADERIRPSVQHRWGSLLDAEKVDEVCDRVIDTLDRVANTSRWAVDLGADGLEPHAAFVDIAAKGLTGVRIHFAFHPDMPDGLREAVIDSIRQDTSEVDL